MRGKKLAETRFLFYHSTPPSSVCAGGCVHECKLVCQTACLSLYLPVTVCARVDVYTGKYVSLKVRFFIEAARNTGGIAAATLERTERVSD